MDALTEGEGGFESALLNAITGEDDLIDPRDLFKQDVVDDEITAEDNAFWNVDVDDIQAARLEIDFSTYSPDEDELEAVSAIDHIRNPQVATPVAHTQDPSHGVVSDKELENILASITVEPLSTPHSDPLAQFAIEELGAVLSTEPIPRRSNTMNPQIDRQYRYVSQYLETVSDVNQDRLRQYLPRLLTLVREGEWDDKEEVKKIAGILEDCFMDSDPMKKRLLSRVTSWLKQKKLITADDVGDIVERVIDLSLMAFDLKPLQLDIFEGMRIAQKETIARRLSEKPPASKPQSKKKRNKKTKLDLLAIPDEPESPDEYKADHIVKNIGLNEPLQLKLFS